jgi:mono/diheme cytochrome c family protein
MKRILRWAALALGALVVLAGAAALYVEVRGIPRYSPVRVEVSVPRTPQAVARGRRFASMLCSGCHLDPATGAFSGKWMIDLPKEFGTAYAANITRDPVHGIGSWTDGEIVYLLRTGVRRDGRYAPPWMPKLPHMSDADLLSIVAFLRSDDPWVGPSQVPTQPSRPTFLAKVLANTVFKPLPYPRVAIVAPDPGDRVALGRYLVASLDCYGCHSADFKKMNILEPEKSEGFMGGGNEMLGAGGHPIVTANLTPDPETGIGRWTEQQFVRALRQGLRPGDAPLRPPMRRFFELTDEEAGAIRAYLRTVPPIRRARPAAPPPAAPAPASDGERVFRKHECGACHGEDGSGPIALKDAWRKYGTDAELAERIRRPSSFVPNTQMPTWDGVIAEADYAPLAAYVRSLGAPAAR